MFSSSSQWFNWFIGMICSNLWAFCIIINGIEISFIITLFFLKWKDQLCELVVLWRRGTLFTLRVRRHRLFFRIHLQSLFALSKSVSRLFIILGDWIMYVSCDRLWAGSVISRIVIGSNLRYLRLYYWNKRFLQLFNIEQCWVAGPSFIIYPFKICLLSHLVHCWKDLMSLLIL